MSSNSKSRRAVQPARPRDEYAAKTAKSEAQVEALVGHSHTLIEPADDAFAEIGPLAESGAAAGEVAAAEDAMVVAPAEGEIEAAPDELEPPPVEKAPLARPAVGAQVGALLRTTGERAGSSVRTAGERLRALTAEQWAWIAVLGLAAVLRFWGLGDRPLHHDESMHAYFSLAFANDPSSYAYNPLLHGPFQFHAEGLMFAFLQALQNLFVHGAVGNPWINDTTARFVPALFGIGIVALPLGLRRELGRLGALVAAFLLAVSPFFVYFSRFLREDVYFNFFMFAMVVCAVRFARSRSTRSFLGLAAATILAYATFEGIFLTFAIFGGFLVLLAVWELASGLAKRLPDTFSSGERTLLARAGLLALLGGVAALAAHIALQKLNELSAYVSNPKNTDKANISVKLLEDTSVSVLIAVSVAVALLVIGTLIWQMYRDLVYFREPVDPALLAGDPGLQATEIRRRRTMQTVADFDDILTAPSRWWGRLRDRLDPTEQPFLRTLLCVTWVQWFLAFVVSFLLFAVLYFIIPSSGSNSQATGLQDGFNAGLGKGMWDGLYYWLQQQNVARGGQPWYYYLLLIPLYEQLVCVFGLAGVVYAFFRPDRFRLFLVWWFVASLVLYSWAGEKMPWLTIQILLPLFLLAGIALARLLRGCAGVLESLAANDFEALRAAPLKPTVSVAGTALALLLLVPMLYGMLTVTQVDAANAPHEMMSYVQTTPDVQLVMNKIQRADQRLYGGKHLLRIGVGTGMEWPFYWYLRDYKNVFYGFQAQQEASYGQPMDVIIAEPSNNQYGTDGQTWMATHQTGWQMHQYKLRWWWDENYKPAPSGKSQPSQFIVYGVGLGPYLSYGQAPKPGQPQLDLGKAAGRVWSWLWTRKAFGYTDGSTDFVFIVRDGLPIAANP